MVVFVFMVIFLLTHSPVHKSFLFQCQKEYLVSLLTLIKLDLSRAYKQMRVKEECQSLLLINTHL